MKPITLTSAQLDHALGVSTMANDLESIGRNAYECVSEMVQALNQAHANDDDDAYQAAREAIENDALSVEVRGAWQSVGDPPDHTPDEYRILLSTGGPATRIVGELTHGEPATARLQAQDWGTQWTDYHKADEAILLAYASIFYYEVG